MLLAHTGFVQDNILNVLNEKGYLATDMYEIHPKFMRAKEPLYIFKIKHLDTSKFSLRATSHVVDLEASTDTSGSKFSYHSDKKVKIWIREVTYYFDWEPLETYDLYINDKKYTITGESKYKPIYTLETNDLIIRSSKGVAYIILIQEIQEKPAPVKK
jgi:hypothetical protein